MIVTMDDILLLVVLGAAAYLAWLFVPLISEYAHVAWSSVTDRLEEAEQDIRERSSGIANRYDRERRRQSFMKSLNNQLDDDSAAASLDRGLLRAKKDALFIRRVLQEQFPDAVRLCVCTHRMTALATGVTYIYEIADTPECFALRERVIGLSEACVERISTYPLLLRDPSLIQNLAVLRGRILPICRNCPYLEYRLDQAPLLCPSAEIVGIKPEISEPHEDESDQDS